MPMMLKNMETAKRNTYFKIGIDEFKTKIIPFNLNPKGRTENFPADDEDMALVNHIKSGGIIPPLEINKTKQNGEEIYQLVSGHRRRAAILFCIENGVSIDQISIMVIGSDMSEAEMLARTMADSKNKHWTKSEKANAVKKFIAWGWSEKKIAECIGDSIGTVRTLLTLSSGSEAIKQAVDDKEIPQTEAVAIIKESAGSIEEQNGRLGQIKNEVKEGKRTSKGRKRQPKIDRKIDDEPKIDNGPPKVSKGKINQESSILDDLCGRVAMSREALEAWHNKLGTIVDKSEEQHYYYECLEIVLGYHVIV